MHLGIYAATLTLLLTGGTAAAQTPTPTPQQTSEAMRYRLEKTQNGFIRLDQQTGAVSFCREETGGLTCRMAADERAAFEQDLDLLEKRVDALEQKLGSASSRSALPSEPEIEQSLSIMERFMRRFMGIINEFKQEDAPAPNRT